jgi:hypothetical protein
VTRRTRPDGRARSAAAALLAALAVVGSLLVGQSAAAQGAGSVAASGTAARGAVPAGVALRDHRDVARPGPRRGAREQSAPRADSSLRAAVGHGPAPVAGLTAAAVLLLALVVGGVVASRGPATVRRRTPASRRDRAPPVLALA